LMRAAVLAAALAAALSAPASASFLDHALKVALWSAIATDRYQTAQWIDYTPQAPMALTWESQSGAGARGRSFRCDCIYERNPLLAGERDKLEPYFDWWATAVEAAPLTEWPPLARAAAALAAANWLRVVANNNRLPDALGQDLEKAGMAYTGPRLSKYVVIEFRTRF